MIPLKDQVRLFARQCRMRFRQVTGRDATLQVLADLQKIPRRSHPRPLKIAVVSQPGTFGVLVDAFLAASLQAAGHDVRVFFDDGLYPISESLPWQSPHTWNIRKRVSATNARRVFSCAGLSSAGISATIGQQFPQVDRSEPAYQTIHTCSMLRHYRVGTLDDAMPGISQRSELTWQAISMSAALGGELASRGFQRVVVNHGLYSSTGPMRLQAQQAGIPVLSYDLAKRRHCMNFTWNHSSDEWCIDEIWERVKDQPWAAGEEEEIEKYFVSRRSHHLDQHVFNLGPEEDVASLRHRFGVPDDAKLVTMFTNVLWDAAAANREICFQNAIEWVVKTCRWIENQKGVHLIIKVHPAENVIGTRQPFKDLLLQRIPHLPSNVHLVAPDAKVNSFSFCAASDVGLVHTSTVGLEMANLGKPVVLVAKCHYRGKGFTFDPNSESEYFSLLGDLKNLKCGPEMQGLAKRYAFLSLCKYQYPFPFVTRDPTSVYGGRLEDFDPATLLDRPILKYLIKAIENVEPIMYLERR